MANVKFSVEGMSCGHCKAAVEKALGQVSGVSAVQVDLERKEVAVAYDAGKTNPAAMKAVIEDIGYEVVGE